MSFNCFTTGALQVFFLIIICYSYVPLALALCLALSIDKLALIHSRKKELYLIPY